MQGTCTQWACRGALVARWQAQSTKQCSCPSWHINMSDITVQSWTQRMFCTCDVSLPGSGPPWWSSAGKPYTACHEGRTNGAAGSWGRRAPHPTRQSGPSRTHLHDSTDNNHQQWWGVCLVVIMTNSLIISSLKVMKKAQGSIVPCSETIDLRACA